VAVHNSWPLPMRRVLGDALNAIQADVIEYWMGEPGSLPETIPVPVNRLVMAAY